MDYSTSGFPIHHQLPELAQIHVHQVGDAIQPSHPLSSPSPAFNLCQHQGLFKWYSSSHNVAKILEHQLEYKLSNEYLGLISFRMDWFDLLAVQGTLKSLLQHHSSKASILWCSAPFPLVVNPRNCLESAYLQICVPPNKICGSQLTFHPEYLPFHYSSVDCNNALFPCPLSGSFVVPPTKPFSSVTQLCPILCNPMDCSKPDFPVHHQLLEFSQTHVHPVGNVIQSPHPLFSPSLLAFNFSQHHGFF